MASTKANQGKDLEMASTEVPVPCYRFFPSVRIFMIFLAFCSLTAINCGFAAFNFAIVCMVKSSSENGTDPKSESGGEFEWDKSQQANLIAAYAWGAIWTSIPGGWLSDKYGGKFVFLSALLLNVVSTAMSPWAAYRGEAWIFAARFFNGMAGGAGWPSVISLAARWGNPSERAILIALGTVGVQFGQLLTVGVSGVLCHSSAGWPSIFYILAGFSALIAVVWFFFYTDHPDRCRFISSEELRYIKSTNHSAENQPKPKVPWRYILLSTAACSIYLCHFCNIWMVTFLSEFVPTYGKEVLGLNIENNGFYSALPLLTSFVSCLIFGTMADKISCRSRSTTFSVKMFNSFCMGVPCAGLLALAFLDRSSGVGGAVFCLCLCTFFYASGVAGFIRCMVLIAPKFSGTISSVSNVYSYVSSIAMPYVIGVVTKDGSAAGWHYAFYIGLAISLFGGLEFFFFGSGEEQKWAKQNSNDSQAPSSNEKIYQIERLDVLKL